MHAHHRFDAIDDIERERVAAFCCAAPGSGRSFWQCTFLMSPPAGFMMIFITASDAEIIGHAQRNGDSAKRLVKAFRARFPKPRNAGTMTRTSHAPRARQIRCARNAKRSGVFIITSTGVKS
ncbi:hypothetical protein OKW43_002912 [Paraburkholderia sp. WC7.3g]